MKKIFILYLSLFTLPTSALVTQNIPNACVFMDADAVFTINEYQCNPGEFLPADALGCVQCPNGYTCPGGTFAFDETKAQGLVPSNNITQNMNKSCAANTGQIMDAVFTPNIINLNWYSVGDTVYETNTCTYGQPITLPATNPTRPGYIFSGWRLRTNN